MTYTELEVTVFNKLVDICVDAHEADVTDLSNETGLPKITVKGVIGSLVKKELVVVGVEYRDSCILGDAVNSKKFMTINPIINGDAFAFGCDNYTDEETQNLKIKQEA